MLTLRQCFFILDIDIPESRWLERLFDSESRYLVNKLMGHGSRNVGSVLWEHWIKGWCCICGSQLKNLCPPVRSCETVCHLFPPHLISKISREFHATGIDLCRSNSHLRSPPSTGGQRHVTFRVSRDRWGRDLPSLTEHSAQNGGSRKHQQDPGWGGRGGSSTGP